MGKKYIVTKGDNEFLYRTSVNSHGAVSATMLLGGKELKPYVEPDIEKVAKGNYQQGLNDLWEAMQKAIKMYCEIDNEVFLRVFHDVKCDWGESVLQALFKNTPQHLIDSIRQYEQKQEEQIQVGDEVITQSGETIIVTCPLKSDDLDWLDGMDLNGRIYSFLKKNCTKTGKHYPEMAAILEKMKEGQDG